MKNVFGISVRTHCPTNRCRASAQGNAGMLPVISGILPETFCACECAGKVMRQNAAFSGQHARAPHYESFTFFQTPFCSFQLYSGLPLILLTDVSVTVNFP